MSHIINISRTKLAELYTHRLLSSYQIANKFHCNQKTIMNRLRKYKIQTRTIQQGKALTRAKYPRKDFDGTPENKAYIIGFRLGDLNVSKTHPNSPTIRVQCNSTKEEQSDLIRALFSKYGHVGISRPDRFGATKIWVFLNNSFGFLLPKSEKIERWILNSSPCSLSFLAGYIDAEGSFGLNCRRQPFFSVKSQDKTILTQIQKNILPMIGVRKKLLFVRAAGTIVNGVRSNKDVYGIFIYNKVDLRKLIVAVVGLLRHRKRKTDALKVYSRINYERT